MFKLLRSLSKDSGKPRSVVQSDMLVDLGGRIGMVLYVIAQMLVEIIDALERPKP